MAAKAAASVEKMVPASADLMVLANLDPSVSQKLNLLRALHRFPQTSSDKSISDAIDKAFKGSGLSYSADVEPWLGAELAVSARLNYDTNSDSTAALYAISRDDARARAALLKLRSGDAGKQLQWRDESYNGFQISVGTPAKASDKPAAYSLVNHVVVISNSGSLIHEIIDTEEGRAPRLTDSAGYRATMSGLPSDRLGFAYVNGDSLVTGIKKQLAKTTAASKPVMGNISDLDAFSGVGATVSAAGNGLSADMLVKLDQSKLSAASREALTQAGQPDLVLSWIPRGSDAFLAVSSVRRSLETILDSSRSDPTIKASTDAFGLTGPGSMLKHLTGDAAVEVQVASGTPAAALLLRADDPASLKAFFSRLLTLASSVNLGGAGASRSAGRPALATVITTYRGVSITSLQLPQAAQAPLAPSYAVLDGMGVMASNLAELKAVIDAHKGGVGIGADPTYQEAAGASLKQPGTVVYFNAGSLLRAARGLLKSSPAAAINDRTLADTQPLRAVMITGNSRVDRIYARFFLLID
jgi:hypothetical protein